MSCHDKEHAVGELLLDLDEDAQRRYQRDS